MRADRLYLGLEEVGAVTFNGKLFLEGNRWISPNRGFQCSRCQRQIKG